MQRLRCFQRSSSALSCLGRSLRCISGANSSSSHDHRKSCLPAPSPTLSSSTSPTTASPSLPSEPDDAKAPVKHTASFAYFFKDLSTTIDIAPVRRPQLIGSLHCALEKYPLSVFLVEACAGVTHEGVTQLVQQRAVRFAEYVAESRGCSVKEFLLRYVCGPWPTVTAHLRSMDLSLQLSLELVERSSGRDADAELVATAAAKAPCVLVRCRASLYDPWEAEPRLIALELGQDSHRSSGAEAKIFSLEGELEAVVSRVMSSVQQELSVRCAALVKDGAEEAARYVREAGREASQLWLTSQLQSCSKRQATQHTSRSVGVHAPHQHLPSLLREESRLMCSSWALSCRCWRHAAWNVAVGLQVVLEYAEDAVPSLDGTPSRSLLTHSTVNRGLVPFKTTLAASEEAEDEEGVLSNGNSFWDLHGEQRRVLTAAELSEGMADGSIAVSSSWADTPLSVCGELLTCAAVLSPSIAHDWLDSERCGEWVERLPRGAASLASPTAIQPRGGALPSLVRWSSFAGRATISSFLSAAAHRDAPTVDDEAEACCLPPLWPRVRQQKPVSYSWCCAALRELLQSEAGLRHLPRTYEVVVMAKEPPVSFEYDAELVISASVSQNVHAGSAAVNATRVRVGAKWYVDVAEAALAHAPWALPLSTRSSTPSPKAASCTQPKTTRKKEHSLLWLPLLSVTDSLRKGGVVSATWDESEDVLLCHRAAQCGSPLRFAHVSTVGGFAALLRFCAKTPVNFLFHTPKRVDLQKLVQKLLRSMTRYSKEGRSGKHGHATTSAAPVLPLLTEKERRRHVADLHFPFNAGYTRIFAATELAHAGEVRRLLSYIQHVSSDPVKYTALLATAPPANSSFFQLWRFTEPWVHPRGPLRITLTPKAAAHDKTEKGNRTASFHGHSVATFPLELCIARVLAGSDGREAPAQSGEEEGSLSRRRSVVLPVSGGAWMCEAYAALREEVLALSMSADTAPSTPLFDHERHPIFRSCGADGEDTNRLLRECSDYDQLSHALLCTLLNTSERLRGISHIGVLLAVFDNQIEYIHGEKEHEMRLQVTPGVYVSLASTETNGNVAKGVTGRDLGWREGLAEAFHAAAAPELRTSLCAVARLRNSYFTALKSPLTTADFTLRFRWESRPEASLTAKASSRLFFSAEIVGDGLSLPTLRLAPAVEEPRASASASAKETRVLYATSGYSLAEVLDRVSAVLSDDAGRSSATSASQNPTSSSLLAVAHVRLAALHHLCRVTTQFDVEAQKVRVLGWGQNSDATSHETALCLAEEAATEDRVPQVVFPLHRRLLKPVMDQEQETSVETLLNCPTSDLREKLCTALGCADELLQLSTYFANQQWRCCMPVPVHLFHLSPATSNTVPAALPLRTAPPTDYYYVQSSHRLKKTAVRHLYMCLCHWVCFAHTLKVDYLSEFGVWCSVTNSMCCPASEPAMSVRPPLHSAGDGSGDGENAFPSLLLKPPFPLPAPQHARGSLQMQATSSVQSMQEMSAVKVSFLDAMHSKMKEELVELVDDDDAGGRVVLKFSQTFGLELVYRISTADLTCAGKGSASDASVQLLRESWRHGTWALAQILLAEAAVLRRLVYRGQHDGESGSRNLHGNLSDLMQRHALLRLSCGAEVSRREFCVSFLRRYFGWRVCEQDDLADLPVTDAQSSIVVYECIVAAAASPSLSLSSPPPHQQRQHQRQQSHPQRGAHLRKSGVQRASLKLGQIMSQGDATVRLAQVLVDVEDASADAARALLWDTFARRVKEVFGVSRLMTVTEVDAGIIRFMGEPSRSSAHTQESPTRVKG